MTPALTAGRELDALIAEKVMGLEVARATAPATHVEGEWSVRPADEVASVGPESGWICHSGLEPVYVRHCGCEYAKPEPHVADDWLIESSGGRGAAEAKCAEWYKDEVAEYEADMERWDHSHRCLDVVSHYSTDIAAAWEVWVYVTKKRPDLAIGLGANFGPAFKKWVILQDQDGDDGYCIFGGGYNTVEADTAPLAICLAALKIVEAS